MSETTVEAGAMWRRREKVLARSLCALVALLGFYGGATDGARTTGRFDLLIGLVLAITATSYCATVCKARGCPLPTNSLWLVVITWPISVPVCLMWARGRSGWWWVLVQILIVWAVGIAGVAAGALWVQLRG